MKDRSAANLLLVLLVIAAFALFAVIGVYVSEFGPSPSGSQEVWAQFGDYLGGTLNPIFGYLTLVAIVMTLAIQTRQLDISHEQLSLSRAELIASREELKRSAEAQIETATALKEQARLSSLSAKIAAVSAALEAVDQELNRLRASQSRTSLLGVAVLRNGQVHEERRQTLEAKLNLLIQEAEAA